MFRVLLWFSILIASLSQSLAQIPHLFFSNSKLPTTIKFEKQVADFTEAQIQSKKIVSQLIQQGYITASCDSIQLRKDTVFVEFYLGNKYNYGNVDCKNLTKPLLEQFGFKTLKNNAVDIENLKNSMLQTIAYFENFGYPFAYFYWDSLIVRNDTISGSIYFEKNIEIRFDTISLIGDAGLSKNFLHNYLGFKPGQKFSESLYNQFYNKLVKLPFVTLVSKPRLFFIGRKAVLFLNLKKRKMDRLDGIVGFAPNTGSAEDSKLLVTGEFHLDFKNLRGSGKGLKIDWQSFKAQSQALNLAATVPFVLNQPMGFEFKGEFLKFDTTFSEASFGGGIQYLFSGLDNIKLFYELKKTSLFSIDTAELRRQKSLGGVTEMKSDRYGMALNWITFDNRLSPQKGFLALISTSISRRKIEKNREIEKVKFYNSNSKSYYSLYDSLDLVSYQFLLQYNLAKPIKLRKNFILFNELTGYHFVSPKIYLNELYRFGGNQTFRGFNEQSLFASSLTIMNMELRYLFSELSFIKVFGNLAYYENRGEMINKVNSDIPYGFGTGLSLETAAGLFNISVALGKSKYNPIEFKNAKIHFGLINYF